MNVSWQTGGCGMHLRSTDTRQTISPWSYGNGQEAGERIGGAW